jgi:hypothetical protein
MGWHHGAPEVAEPLEAQRVGRRMGHRSLARALARARVELESGSGYRRFRARGLGEALSPKQRLWACSGSAQI